LRVVGHRRLRFAQRSLEIARADLACVGHEAQEAQAHRVAQRGEDSSQVLRVSLRERRRQDRGAAGIGRRDIDAHRYDNLSGATMSRVQLALNVSDLDEAITFYSRLFATEPAKVRPGYANFAIAEPPLKLVLIEGSGAPGSLNHLGVEVESAEQVAAADARLR